MMAQLNEQDIETVEALQKEIAGWKETSEAYQRMFESNYEKYKIEIQNIFKDFENASDLMPTPNGMGFVISLDDFLKIKHKYGG